MSRKNSSSPKTEKQFKLHIRSTVYETAIVWATSKKQAKEFFDTGEVAGDIAFSTQYIDESEIIGVEEI
jgi:hypothetical protein